MRNNNSQQGSKQLSFRLPPEEYDELKSAAEHKGISLSDEAKIRLKTARNSLSTQELLRMTEARLKSLIFNMTCAVAGINDNEIIDAEKRFVDITKNGVKREE